MESALPTDLNETHVEKKNIGVASKQSVETAAPLLSARKKFQGTKAPDSDKFTSRISRPTISSSISMSKRRNSTGEVLEKQIGVTQKRLGGMGSLSGKKTTSTTEPIKNNSGGRRASLLPSTNLKSPVPVMKNTSFNSQSSPKQTISRLDSVRKSSSKSSKDSSLSNSNGRNSFRKTISNVSSPSSISSSVASSPKLGSLSSSINKSSRLVGRRKVSTQESHDSRLIMLPQIEFKAGDDLRMDLRGHRVRSLTARGLKLSQNLEFVYLRDNLLSSLEGIEILKRVKVLDLSFNDFKGPDFDPLENCKALQQLYLAGNHITSLASLPELPNLEFLSVAQNRLKSLCMASQPRLQVLAASKNRISTLKSFPHFPILEHLRVEENPILEMTHLEAASVLLVGPTLKKFNDRDLRAEEIELAKKYPAHTALCIRDGWEFCAPEFAPESTFAFLAERWKNHIPPGYILKDASVDLPFEADACHSRFVFSGDNEPDLILKYQWFIGDGAPKGFVAIDEATSEVYWPKKKDIGKFLKVECTPILDGVAYPSIFVASSYVSPGTGCPKVLDLTVNGDLVEGNIIKCQANVAWCGGTPGKGVTGWFRRKWNSGPVVITGAKDEEYKLTIDDIDSSLVLMYTPVTEDGIKGEPQYANTDFIKAAAPSVNSVNVFGNPVEGSTIRGVGKYFGGREGPSKFEWSRLNKETGDILLVCAGTIEYTLTKEDIGWQMIFSYIPMNFEGQEGITVSVVTDTVRKAPPRVSGLQILGDLREESKVTIAATVTGGTEGSSRVQWFKKISPLFQGENDLEAVSSSKIAKAFRIPLGVVGYYLIAKFTPMAPDGVSGEPEYAISKNVVENLPPSLNFLSVTGSYCEGEMLTASYGYVGGHEGKSLYSWYLCETETDTGVLIPDASEFLQYRITKDAIDKFISFQCTPIREDGIVGDTRIFFAPKRVCSGTPSILALEILGEAIEGVTLFADRKYWGGDEGTSVFHWFLSDDNGITNEIEGARDSSYLLSYKDIGSMLCVSCEPIRNDGARGSTVISHLVGPILPGPPICKSIQFNGSMIEGECLSFSADYIGGEKGNCTHEWFRIKKKGFREKLTSADYWDLTLSDVGMCIELDYTPFRKDGLKGFPVTIRSSIIHPAEPKGTELIIPVCCEDQQVIPKKSYYGGHEGDGVYNWYRANKKMEMADMIAIFSSEGALAVGNDITYTPTLEDVGAYLVLCWLPTRNDGKPGEPVIAISNPVLAALPVVSNVCIKKLSSTAYVGEGKYYGGHEGPNIYSWYRETAEGTTSIINGANSTIYEVTDFDYNFQLIFGYMPVRSDSIVGELKLSEPTKTIFPELPQIELLSFLGKEVEGEILRAIETIPNNEVQKNVWNKYIKNVKYQWFFSKDGDAEEFEILHSQCSQTYKLRLEDIGRCLKCDCIVTDVFGRSSSIVSAVTVPISPGIPKIGKLEIEGRGYHTNLYAVRGLYSGGKEGKSRIQWLRSMVGSPDLISIPGEVDRMYESNVDDVGYRLVAVYTPVREDGVEGQPVSASTETISIDPDVSKEVKQNIGLGTVKFETLCHKDQSSKKAPSVGNLERRLLEVNRKRVKVVKPGSKTSFPSTEIRGTYAPPFHVELYRNDQHRFKIVVDSDTEMDLMVQTRHMRDVILLVIRGFGQKFNSTSLNSLLKIDN